MVNGESNGGRDAFCGDGRGGGDPEVCRHGGGSSTISGVARQRNRGEVAGRDRDRCRWRRRTVRRAAADGAAGGFAGRRRRGRFGAASVAGRIGPRRRLDSRSARRDGQFRRWQCGFRRHVGLAARWGDGGGVDPASGQRPARRRGPWGRRLYRRGAGAHVRAGGSPWGMPGVGSDRLSASSVERAGRGTFPPFFRRSCPAPNARAWIIPPSPPGRRIS